MKQIIRIFIQLSLLALLLPAFTNCNWNRKKQSDLDDFKVLEVKDGDVIVVELANGEQREIQPTEVDFKFTTTAMFRPYCLECHSGAGGKGGVDVSSYQSTLKSLVPNDSANSPLWKSVESGAMPTKEPKPEDAEKQVLRIWIDYGAKETASGSPAPPPPTTEKPTVDELSFAAIKKAVFKPFNCIECHSPSSTTGAGIDLTTYDKTMEFVVAGNAEQSKLYKSIKNESMPKGLAVSKENRSAMLKILKEWIDAGAPEVAGGPGADVFPSVLLESYRTWSTVHPNGELFQSGTNPRTGEEIPAHCSNNGCFKIRAFMNDIAKPIYDGYMPESGEIKFPEGAVMAIDIPEDPESSESGSKKTFFMKKMKAGNGDDHDWAYAVAELKAGELAWIDGNVDGKIQKCSECHSKEIVRPWDGVKTVDYAHFWKDQAPVEFIEVKETLGKFCITCHQHSSWNEIENLFLNSRIVPADVEASKIYTYTANESMPPSSALQPTPAERERFLQVLKSWIEAGAPTGAGNPPPPPPPPEPDPIFKDSWLRMYPTWINRGWSVHPEGGSFQSGLDPVTGESYLGHGDAQVRVFFNAISNAIFRSYNPDQESVTFRKGSLLIKDILEDPSDPESPIRKVFMMRKQEEGFNHIAHDWAFAVAEPDENGEMKYTAGQYDGNAGRACVNCHSKPELRPFDGALSLRHYWFFRQSTEPPPPPPPPPTVTYEDINPLLVRHCKDCHGWVDKGREKLLENNRIVPGNVEASQIWFLVKGENLPEGKFQMPAFPSQMSDEDRAAFLDLFGNWIEAGAP